LVSKVERFQSILKGLEGARETHQGLVDFSSSCKSMTIAGTAGARDDELVLILHGNFDGKRIEEAMTWVAQTKPQGIGLNTQKLGARPYHKVNLPGEIEPWFIALLDESNLVITPIERHVKEAIARATGEAKADLRQDLQAVLRRINSRWGIWFATVENDEVIADITGGLIIGEDVEINVVVTAKTENQVAELTAEIKEDLALAQTSLNAFAQENEALKSLAHLLANVEINPQGGTVHLTLRIPARVVDETLEKLDRSKQNSAAKKD
jgi:hypothetical protein